MKQRLLNWLLKRTINAVVRDDIIRDVKGTVTIGGKPVIEEELRQLIAECKALEGFNVWRIINETIKEDALDRGWNKSTSLEDLNTGKTIFYTLDLQESIIRLIRSKEKKG